ncbi:GLPGLI family protein [Bizionia sediminis]|uniref:GLPGLI family protein n=1 Tax=Bizionia sediminis TaxID=1737064 RepID=A0ABW5KVQ2_9FLAO
MKLLGIKLKILAAACLFSGVIKAQDFQGKAYYATKSKLDLGTWGATMSEAQKKQVQERLKNRLEKIYILTFNKEASIYEEDEKLDAISGATDSWGKNFAPGKQYKNIKTNTLKQNQEFYGKQFLVTDNLQDINWTLTTDTKKVGQYTCMKAVALVPTSDLYWYDFSWDRLRDNQAQNNSETADSLQTKSIKMSQIEAWYTPQIPVSHGPGAFTGLPGLILEVSADNTTILCSKIVMNPEDKTNIEAPRKGTEVSKKDYQEIVIKKMAEMRNMYSGRRGR